MGSWLPAARWCGAALIALAMGCLESGDDSDSDSGPSYYEVWIDSTETTTTASVGNLYGVASCDACPPSEAGYGTCPPVYGPFDSAIGIQWANLTTGASAPAAHGIYGRQSWFFSYCTVTYSHHWQAYVPLAFGPNVIEVIATGPESQPGSDTITITRNPAAPQNVAAQGGASDITVSWDPVESADSYELVCSTAPDLGAAGAQVIAGVTSPFLHAGLPPDAVRYYAVRAIAEGYPGPLSDVVFATAGWVPETIPFPARAWTASDLSLALDSSGAAHVHLSRQGSITNPFLENDYATNSSGTWSTTAVASTSAVSAGLALGADESVHVAYITGWTGTHAVRVAGAWVPEPFDTNASCYARLAIDPLQRVHALFQRNEVTPVQAGRLLHAVRTNATWSSEFIDTTSFGCYAEGSKLSLAVDSSSRAHALYLAGPAQDGVRYATNSSGAWVAETVTTDWVRCLALALDAGGTPHAVWTDDTNTLMHARRESQGVWPSESVDAYAFGPAIAIDPGGDVHISYLHYAQDQLRYARRRSGLWEVLPVGASASQSSTALVVDTLGFVHVAYANAGEIRYVSNR